MQYFVKSICLILLVFHCFPVEDRFIWWNVASLIISLIPYTTRTRPFHIKFFSNHFPQQSNIQIFENLEYFVTCACPPLDALSVLFSARKNQVFFLIHFRVNLHRWHLLLLWENGNLLLLMLVILLQCTILYHLDLWSFATNFFVMKEKSSHLLPFPCYPFIFCVRFYSYGSNMSCHHQLDAFMRMASNILVFFYELALLSCMYLRLVYCGFVLAAERRNFVLVSIPSRDNRKEHIFGESPSYHWLTFCDRSRQVASYCSVLLHFKLLCSEILGNQLD